CGGLRFPRRSRNESSSLRLWPTSDPAPCRALCDAAASTWRCQAFLPSRAWSMLSLSINARYRCTKCQVIYLVGVKAEVAEFAQQLCVKTWGLRRCLTSHFEAVFYLQGLPKVWEFLHAP